LCPGGVPSGLRLRGICSTTARRVERLTERALEPAINGPAEFAQFLVRDRQAAERVVKASGLERDSWRPHDARCELV
jgi:hypothetical protein